MSYFSSLRLFLFQLVTFDTNIFSSFSTSSLSVRPLRPLLQTLEFGLH
ncbi:hypothetical protein BLGI_4021 [Brevibacillus laterosporus GI-9]|nr:hypothetical protein BLGI_4021 [Brevibacillus laterosporus GI-9]